MHWYIWCSYVLPDCCLGVLLYFGIVVLLYWYIYAFVHLCICVLVYCCIGVFWFIRVLLY